MMSATPDERILKCFGDNVLQIDIPESQTFPITEIKQEVEDKEDINDVVISHTFNIIKEMSKEDGKVEPGHILIFLSGNSRMNEIQTKIFDDAEKECSSDECTVVVMKQFKSMFQKGDIQRFYHRLDSYIKKETNRINAEDDKKKILFILPIKYGSYVSNEQKMIGKNPIKSHPNLIKVIMATNAIESSITIDSLAAVVDSGIFNHSTYNKENGLTTLTEKPISIQNQIQRRGRVGRTMPGVYVSIQLKNEKLMKSLPPAILTSDISLNILSLRKIGCKLENITNLPDKLSKAEIKKYKSELVKFNALTDKTYELTPFGDFLGSFPMLSPFIASAILTVAGYTNDEDQIKKNILKESEKELKLLLGILISLIIGSKDLCINKYSKKLKKFFDKRSDIITFVCSIIDLSRFKGKEINANANKYGLNGPIVIKIINQIQQTAQSLFETNALKDNTKFNKRDNKRMDSDDISDDEDDDNQEEEEEYEENNQKDDENENKIIKNPLHELRNYVKKLVDGDQLYQFIQKLIVEIGNNKPDWISCRRVNFKTIEKASFNPSFVYLGDKSLSFAKGKDNSFITLKMRPGFVGLDSPGSAFILSITHDNNTKLNYGSMIHWDLENEANKEILHPVSVETSAALDNDFSIPLIESYLKNDIEHFQKFHSNGFSDSKENTSFFKDSQDCSFDPNNQLKKKYYRFSFIPKDERAIQVFKESITFIENLMPYTPSTILIQHPNLKTIISHHGIGTDIIDSSVHLHNDTDYYAYKLTKESIIFLNENIERLGAINESYSIAMTVNGQVIHLIVQSIVFHLFNLMKMHQCHIQYQKVNMFLIMNSHI